MDSVHVYDDKNQLAVEAARAAVDVLSSTIDQRGSAVWVLAGGSTPLAAYEVIARDFRDALDWSKVTLLLGDERIGPLDDPDNNWSAIESILGDLPTNNIRPDSDLTAEEAASEYERRIISLPRAINGVPRFDLVWLGVGDDGHTLSIFPNHPSLSPTAGLVIPVHNSPKPPADRISLSLRALQGTTEAIVLASGENKKAAVSTALAGGNFPIAIAVNVIKANDGNVEWYIDSAAAAD